MAKHVIRVVFFLFIILICQNFVLASVGCRCLMSDFKCWPNVSIWQTFNESIGGRLIPVYPSAAFCDSVLSNEEACITALAQWTNAAWRSDQIGAMQNHNWENTSCSDVNGIVSCTQGSVPRLGVNATTAEHVQATVRLTKKHNLRLVIKTTGHDYLGRSTASGSLLLWLHHMKDMSLIKEYTSCTGENLSNVIRVGAGVQWGEVYSWLSAYNLIAIGGASSTVSATGGFLQGGGHGPLTRWKGMAADQVLEFNVVTADGQQHTVNACHNQDLFWALRGGGGGTFAIILTAVLRTFPSPSILSANYLVSARNELRYARFIRDFIRLMPALADANWAGYFYMRDTNLSIALFLPNGQPTSAATIFDQLIQNDTDLQIIGSGLVSFSSFYEYFKQVMAPTNSGGGNVILGSRLIPEINVRNEPDRTADALFLARGHSKNESLLIGHLVAGGQVSSLSVDNSVNPAWRSALLHVIHAQGWPEGTSAADQKQFAAHLRKQVAILETISGGSQSGCYLNEADINEPNWQEKFFGTQTNYNRLKSIKKTVDPNGLFICKNCVGSDDWSSDLNCPNQSTAVKHRLSILILIFMTALQVF